MTIAAIHPGPAGRPFRGQPPQPTWVLSQLADGVAARPELWSAVAHHHEACRRPVRLAATDVYEIWVIGWMPDQGLELHDHGSSYGLLQVVEGALFETVLTDHGLEEQVLDTGRRRFLPSGTIHAVKGHREPATSVHVYSPPLTRMTHYAAGGRRLETQLIAPVAPVLPSSVVPQVLHPAGPQPTRV